MLSKKKIKLFLKIVLTFLVFIEVISLLISYLTQKKNTSYPSNSTWLFYNRELTYLYSIYKSENTECSPLLNATPFSVQIDGVRYPKRIPLYQNKSINFKCLNSSTHTKKILMWNKFNGLPNIKYKFGVREPFEFLNCPVTSCELTNNRSRLADSDLVLFHLRNEIDQFPNFTSKYQRFVHVIFESPIHCHACMEHENAFNFTAGYRTQSDFVSTYFTDSGLYWELNEKFDPKKDFLQGKTEFAAAMISSCGDFSLARTEYINELKKYISVGMYGKCGQLLENECGPMSNSKLECRDYLSSKYKFFLSFENSVCSDYITEKFFNTLRYNIIVVVLGGGIYTDYIPKRGYINALDFKTPKHLADYLIYLSKNSTAYNEYFMWKKFIKFLSPNTNPENPNKTAIYSEDKIVLGAFLCEMCIKLHLENMTGTFESKQISSLKSMYGLKENCRGTLPGQFNLVKGENIRYSGYMSPED